MSYTKQEEKELNQQLERWKKRQLTAVKGNHIDEAFGKMNDYERSVWTIIAKADTYREVSVGAWEMAEKVICKYCKLAR
jgi:hypothetical protein